MPNALTLTDALQVLAAEPLFELSMSSRELFHTNLISWLIRNHPEAGRDLVGAVFGHPGDPQQELLVDREKLHVDLHIHSFSGHDIWVEMKVGAVPSGPQLIGYATRLRRTDRQQRFVLLSLQPLEGLPMPWVGVGLNALADGFEGCLPSIEPQFDRSLIEHESALLRALVQLGRILDPTADTLGSWFVSSADRSQIARVRAGTVVEKLHVGAAVNVLRREFPNPALESGAGLTNGTGLLEFRRTDADGRSVGWQLQGRAYRLFAESKRPSSRGERGQPLGVAPKDLQTISPWFNFDNAKASLPTLSLGSRAAGQGKFGPVFAYQYLQLPPDVSNGEVMQLLSSETARLEQLDI